MTEVEAIEKELSETRADLEDHVDELASQLSLGRILDEFVLGDRMNLSEIASNETLTKLVIPGALVGAGVTMFLAGGGMGKVSEMLGGGSSPKEASDTPDEVADRSAWRLARSFEVLDRNLVRLPEETEADFAGRRAGEYALVLEMEKEAGESDHSFSERIHAARDMALAAGHEASERMKAMAAKARHAAEDAAHAAGRKAEEAGKAAKSQFEQNPAVGLALSFAVGALLGSVVPMGRKEEDVLSGPVDKAAEKVAAGARSTAEAAQKFAEKLHETTQEIHQQTAH